MHRLVFYEEHGLLAEANQREHNIKHWPRKWKIALIKGMNPMWDDLYPEIVE